MKSVTLAFILSSAALFAAPALAQNAPASDSSAAPAAAPDAGAAPSPEEVQALRAEIQALQARLDRVEAAQAHPAAAPAPGTPSWTGPGAWVASTTIGGKAFINVSDINQKSNGVDSGQNGVQTELKRFYLTVDHRFSDIFSANLTTDFRYNTNGTSKDVLVYVKKAYLQAKFRPEFFVRVGSADLPWVPFVEDIYGYRFVENVLIDRTKYGTSADWGVHIGGTFGNGLISYAASAINGAGYKTLSRSSDTVDLEGRISAQPVKGLTLAVGGYTGKLGKSAANLPSTATPHHAQRFDALIAYTNSRIRAGVEYFSSKDWNNVTTVPEDKTSGWSAFGSFAFTPRLAVFGRYDWVNPNKLSNAPMNDNYFNVGIDLQAVKNIDLALVYKREKVDHGLFPVSNGTIGGSNHGTYDEVGIWSQLKF